MIIASYAINTKASETFVDVLSSINLFRFGEMKFNETYLYEVIAKCNNFSRNTENSPAGQKTRFVFHFIGGNEPSSIVVLRTETTEETNKVNAYIELCKEAIADDKEKWLPSDLHYNNNFDKAHILNPEYNMSYPKD